ncbi:MULTISPECIES: DMT family transporter [Pontibacillus]|uniref:EamA family transporter n=1 Tax=Pontibacillus chungwhensis TaxID=265426 RepID=A0ABY8V2F4_9BACI|nr:MULTISPECIES: EamA family transporter [Pontibacillus]MCD5322515.1 EamA family transporter [Pontibacillus sp. HN14]WIF99800.1 EamA family transporter [Pontibacillus chungwhensis]
MKRLYVGLFTLSLIWGTSFLFIKVLVSSMSVWEVVFWRCTFGAVVLWGIYAFEGKQTLSKLPWGSLLLVGLTNNALPWGLIALSETSITSSLASVLNATTPLWAGLIGLLFFGVRIRGRQWFGIAIGFIGIMVLVDPGEVGFVRNGLAGTLTMIVAAICYGFSSQYIKKNLNDVSAVTVAAITLTFSAMYAFIFTSISGTMNWSLVTTPSIFGSLIGLGAFGSGLGIYIFYYLIQKGSAEFATMVTYLVPVTALLWGSIFLEERIKVSMVVGLAFVLMGVYLAQEKRKKQRGKHHEQQTRVS